MARKKLVGLITQSGTDAPTLTILANTLGSVTLGYTSPGIYTITKQSAFTADKTVLKLGSTESCINSIVRTDANTLTIKTEFVDGNGPAVANAKLTNTMIEIEVFN